MNKTELMHLIVNKKKELLFLFDKHYSYENLDCENLNELNLELCDLNTLIGELRAN